jgi:hypothetical protein
MRIGLLCADATPRPDTVPCTMNSGAGPRSCTVNSGAGRVPRRVDRRRRVARRDL